jgi:hypothetical protein
VADANYVERVDMVHGTANLQTQDRIGAPVSAQTASASATSNDFWGLIVRGYKEATASRWPASPIIFGWLDPILQWLSPNEAFAQ